MDYRSLLCWSALSFILLLFGNRATAQPMQGVAEMSDPQQRDFLLKTLDAGLPESEIDQLGLLALNKSDMVIPELLRRIELALRDRTLADRTITLMAGMVAYAANERAVDGIARLCELDSDKFGFLVARVFDYSVERKNPYTLAYYALTHHSIIEEPAMAWIKGSIRFPGNGKKWARAIWERHGGPPSLSDLRSDPILFKLRGGLPDSVRRELDSMIQSAREGKR